MSVMLFTGVAMASPQFSTSATAPMSIQQEEKVKIEANSLPESVKSTITGYEKVNLLPIAEAWQIAQVDGTFYYKVKFENGTDEKLSKQYDKDGIEIED